MKADTHREHGEHIRDTRDTMFASIDNNTCFNCKGNGHWAKECPTRMCEFCSELGHTVVSCPMKKERMITGQSLSIEDIMFNVSLSCDFQTFQAMKKQVDSLIVKYCGDRYGYVDEYRLARLMFEDFGTSYAIHDIGHMKMLGYVTGRYLSAGNEHLKAFLQRMHDELENPVQFKSIVNEKFNLTIVRHHSGKLSYRKRL